MGINPQANMAALEALFGSEILTKEGPKPTAEALAGKTHIMVYFSAHWCSPCRGYTPELSKAYADSGKKDQTAVLFVSSDRDEAAFAEYYGEMSFMALPFANRSAKEELSTKYGVRGIPTLVLLDGDGTCCDQLPGMTLSCEAAPCKSDTGQAQERHWSRPETRCIV